MFHGFAKKKKKTVYKIKRINDVKELKIPNIDLIIHIDMEPGRTKFKQIFENPNFPFASDSSD